MAESKHNELINKSENKIKELRYRQAIIEKNEEDALKLKQIFKNFNENREELNKYYDNKSKSGANDKEELTILAKFENLLIEIDDWLIKIDKKIDHFFEEVYEKIPGDIFGFIGIILFIISTLTAVILYLNINPNYSIFQNFISDLGVGPNGANIVFNTGWIISSGIILFFHVFEIQKLKKKVNQKKIIKLMALSNVALTLGIFLVGIFPENLRIYHVIAAIFYFLGGLTFFSLYGLISYLNNKVPRSHAFLACIMCIFYLLFFLSPYFPESFSEFGLTITSTEWFTLFAEVSMMLAILTHSLIEDNYKKKYKIEKEYLKKGKIGKIKYHNKLLKYIEKSKYK
ncbi:MAG: DUF998 domain-containing protein [Promethearchaeota archaeon]